MLKKGWVGWGTILLLLFIWAILPFTTPQRDSSSWRVLASAKEIDQYFAEPDSNQVFWQQVNQSQTKDGVTLTLKRVFFDAVVTRFEFAIQGNGYIDFRAGKGLVKIWDDGGRHYIPTSAGVVGQDLNVTFDYHVDAIYPGARQLNMEFVNVVTKDGQLVEGPWRFTIPVNKQARGEYFELGLSDWVGKDETKVTLKCNAFVKGETLGLLLLELIWLGEDSNYQLQVHPDQVILLDEDLNPISLEGSIYRVDHTGIYNFFVQVKPEILDHPFYIAFRPMEVTNLSTGEKSITPIPILTPHEWMKVRHTFVDSMYNQEIRQQIYSKVWKMSKQEN